MDSNPTPNIAPVASGSNSNRKEEKNQEEGPTDTDRKEQKNIEESPIEKNMSLSGISKDDPFKEINLSKEKRPRESVDDDLSDESMKKKCKKDESIAATSSGSSTDTTGSTVTKPSRGTRGSLSDRNEKIAKGTKRTGEKRMSPTSSATNSPKKPSSRDHSDEEASDEASKKSAEPKVPPLKIVLSGPNGNSTGNSDEKKSPSGQDMDKASTKETTESADMPSTNPSSDSRDGFDEDSCSKGGNSNHSSSNTRLTRSRANQGTPGPGDQANDSPRMCNVRIICSVVIVEIRRKKYRKNIVGPLLSKAVSSYER